MSLALFATALLHHAHAQVLAVRFPWPCTTGPLSSTFAFLLEIKTRLEERQAEREARNCKNPRCNHKTTLNPRSTFQLTSTSVWVPTREHLFPCLIPLAPPSAFCTRNTMTPKYTTPTNPEPPTYSMMTPIQTNRIHTVRLP